MSVLGGIDSVVECLGVSPWRNTGPVVEYLGVSPWRNTGSVVECQGVKSLDKNRPSCRDGRCQSYHNHRLSC